MGRLISNEEALALLGRPIPPKGKRVVPLAAGPVGRKPWEKEGQQRTPGWCITPPRHVRVSPGVWRGERDGTTEERFTAGMRAWDK